MEDVCELLDFGKGMIVLLTNQVYVVDLYEVIPLGLLRSKYMGGLC